MNNKDIENQLQEQMQNAVNKFFENHTGIKKTFKLFAIRHEKNNRTIITFSSSKKNNTYLETGTFIRNGGVKNDK